jgi:transcriptional regulator with XRE-family HTH domain
VSPDGQAAPPIPIAQRIKARLKELGQKPGWLADRAGVERSTVTRIVRGQRRPAEKTLRTIAPALDMTFEQLVDGTDAEELLSGAGGDVSRQHLDQAIRDLLAYERKAADHAARHREATEELQRERERRKAAESKLEAAERERDDARAAERRYADALELAMVDIAVLRTEVDKLSAAAKVGTWASRLAAGAASIAAVASVASYLTRAAQRAAERAQNEPADDAADQTPRAKVQDE